MAADEEIDRLLAAPPAGFVEERKRVAAALKAAGRREDAKAIARLHKPSVAVWVVNQLARSEGGLLRRLGELSDQLREGPTKPATKPPMKDAADGYPGLVAQHRDVLRDLRAAAERTLVDGGHVPAPALLERVVHSLRAGMAQEETRGELLRGRLLREMGEIDFTTMMGGAAASETPASEPAPRPRPSSAPAGAPDAGHRAPARVVPTAGRPAAAAAASPAVAAAEREDVEARAAEARERARARVAAEREAERVRNQLAFARKRVVVEERAVEAARRALDTATRAMESARGLFDEKSGHLETARRDAEALEAALADAEAGARAAEKP